MPEPAATMPASSAAPRSRPADSLHVQEDDAGTARERMRHFLPSRKTASNGPRDGLNRNLALTACRADAAPLRRFALDGN